MKRIILLVFLIVLCSCTPNDLFEIEASQILMGTTVKITVIDEDKIKAENEVNAAFNEIKRIEDLMTTFKESQITDLNENSYLENADNEIIYVIAKSNYYSILSNGAFDITVQPILDLYTKSFNELKRPPTDEEIKETLKLVNYKNIIINSSTIKLNKDMKITLGGIAKGYAVDKAIKTLEKNEIKHALVNIGGDVRALGSKNNKPWKIALANPRNQEEYITIIELNNNSVATSGDYERYFDETKKFHHIVNPKTGYSATDLISVTIITKKAIDADAIATSVFVLGPEKGLALIESLDNVEGLLITKDKEIIRSSGFRY